MGILEKLRGTKSTAELEAAVTGIDEEIESLKETHAALKATLPAAPFEKTPAEVTALRHRVRDLEDEIAMMEGVAEETRRRLRETQNADRRALVVTEMKKATAARSDLVALYANYDELLSQLEKVMAQFTPLHRVIDVANGYAEDLENSDLRLRTVQRGPDGTAELRALRTYSHSNFFKSLA